MTAQIPMTPSGKPDYSQGSRELTSRFRFPHASKADEDGFLAVGGDLSPGTLLLAYRNGIFPWTTHPITWWSPDPAPSSRWMECTCPAAFASSSVGATSG